MKTLEVIHKLIKSRAFKKDSYFNGLEYIPLSEKQFSWLINVACKEYNTEGNEIIISDGGINYKFGCMIHRRYTPKYIPNSRKVNCLIKY